MKILQNHPWLSYYCGWCFSGFHIYTIIAITATLSTLGLISGLLAYVSLTNIGSYTWASFNTAVTCQIVDKQFSCKTIIDISGSNNAFCYSLVLLYDNYPPIQRETTIEINANLIPSNSTNTTCYIELNHNSNASQIVSLSPFSTISFVEWQNKYCAYMMSYIIMVALLLCSLLLTVAFWSCTIGHALCKCHDIREERRAANFVNIGGNLVRKDGETPVLNV